MTIHRTENVGIVVEDLVTATEFFVELVLELLGAGVAEGAWLGRVVGVEGVRTEVPMLETPDGHRRLERMMSHPQPAAAATHMPHQTLWVSAV